MKPLSSNDAQIADYISQMCKELADMAKKVNLPLAFDLLTLVAVHTEQHSFMLDQPKTKSAKS